MTREEKLCKIIAKINCFNTEPKKTDPEYYFVDSILTDEMLDPLLQLTARGESVYITDLAEKLGAPVEDTARIVADMVHVGITEYRPDKDGVDRVYLPVFGPGSMENFCMEIDDLHNAPGAAYCFNKFFQELGNAVAPHISLKHSFGGALPVESSIINDPKTVDVETTTHWLKKYNPSIGVAPCQCRQTRAMAHEIGHDLEGEWCVLLGEYAESCIRVGKARRITIEEAFAIIDKAEKRGYVHEVTYLDGPEESLFICNCQWATCAGYRTAWYTNTPDMVASNFRATVNPDNCVACGQCVEVCPMNAVKLGTKLCHIRATMPI